MTATDTASIHEKNDLNSKNSISISHEELQDSLSSIDPKIEASIRRKFDCRVLPLATLVYLMAFIDRYILLHCTLIPILT